MEKRGRTDRSDRRRREAKPREVGSGEGAASALATLRAIEQDRNACAPVEEVQPPADGRRAARKSSAP